MFKKFSVLLFIVVFGCVLSRKSEIPPIKLTKTGSFTQKINTELEIDTSDLVIATSLGNNFSGIFTTYYIVFHENNKATVYNSKTRIGSPEKMATEKHKLSRKKSHFFLDLLKSNYKNNFYNIKSDSLNITSKPIPPSSDTNITEVQMIEESISVSDGSAYHFWVWKSNHFLAYSTYAPRLYIHENYPGSNHRKNLLNLISSYENLIKKNVN